MALICRQSVTRQNRMKLMFLRAGKAKATAKQLFEDVTAEKVCNALLDDEKLLQFRAPLRRAYVRVRNDRVKAVKDGYFSPTLGVDEVQQRHLAADELLYSVKLDKELYQCQCKANRDASYCTLRDEYIEMKV